MWKINGYILPTLKYKDISYNDILIFGQATDCLAQKDNVFVPFDFYDIPDEDGMSAYDYMYGDETTDESLYFSEIISKKTSSEATSCDLVANIENYTAFLILKNTGFQIPSSISIKTHDDIISVKLFYLNKSSNYEELIESAPYIFQNIIFHDDAFECISRVGPLQSSLHEITRHLYVLDQYARDIYLNTNKNEIETLNRLSAMHNIICSGKGSNERISFKKNITFNGCTYELTCNPHTKLFSAHSDARIYFCWGRDEIVNHNLIVVRIGDHWPT